METTFVVENTRACRHEKPRKTSVRVLAALCCLVMSTLANTQTGRSPRLAPLGRHAYDASASSCNGNSILFYNADTGEGAIGKVSADSSALRRPTHLGPSRKRGRMPCGSMR